MSFLKSFVMGALRLLRPGVGQLGTYLPRPIHNYFSGYDAKFYDEKLPLISIVVPTYNQGQFIEQTLRSIIDQNYPNLELIVVDGGSSDNTLNIIKQYEAHIAWWVSEQDSGQTAAINKGFMQSKGEIMAWINSDDLVASGALHQVANYFIKHPKTQVVYGDRILIDEEGFEIGLWILPNHSDRVLKFADFVPQETLYWTRKAWRHTGGQLDETFRFAMDWDFLIRLSKNHLKISHLPKILGLFRIHHQQKTSTQLTSLGHQEMQLIRLRELGFQPGRWQINANIASFLLAAKLNEIRYRFCQKIGAHA